RRRVTRGAHACLPRAHRTRRSRPARVRLRRRRARAAGRAAGRARDPGHPRCTPVSRAPLQMTETARVVVVGGGIWGCSIAYHLARAGVSDVLVLERGELASGNTSQAAGLIGQLRASELMARSIMTVVDRLTRWHAEPYTLAMALARAARRLGVRMRTQTPATAITLERGRVTGVETPKEPIACETVVVAVGPWSELIGAALGLAFDTVPIRHQLWVTAPLDGVPRDMPVVRVPDASVYLRPE